MIGGPLGALLGAAIGHNFDSGSWRLEPRKLDFGGQERIQTVFFTTTFLVMGHLAKVDGRVSEQEIAAARAVMVQMGLTPAQHRVAIRLFGEGKQPDFPLDAVLDQFRRECRTHFSLIRLFIEIQLTTAYADGTLPDKKRARLLHICDRLGLYRFQFDILDALVRARRSGQRAGAGGITQGSLALSSAYNILGLTPRATDAEVKKAYRRLINQHHPDKWVAQGLPEEMMKLATEKTREIKAAYERIKEVRGL